MWLCSWFPLPITLHSLPRSLFGLLLLRRHIFLLLLTDSMLSETKSDVRRWFLTRLPVSVPEPTRSPPSLCISYPATPSLSAPRLLAALVAAVVQVEAVVILVMVMTRVRVRILTRCETSRLWSNRCEDSCLRSVHDRSLHLLGHICSTS